MFQQMLCLLEHFSCRGECCLNTLQIKRRSNEKGNRKIL